jgi:hypothetical protein
LSLTERRWSTSAETCTSVGTAGGLSPQPKKGWSCCARARRQAPPAVRRRWKPHDCDGGGIERRRRRLSGGGAHECVCVQAPPVCRNAKQHTRIACAATPALRAQGQAFSLSGPLARVHLSAAGKPQLTTANSQQHQCTQTLSLSPSSTSSSSSAAAPRARPNASIAHCSLPSRFSLSHCESELFL